MNRANRTRLIPYSVGCSWELSRLRMSSPCIRSSLRLGFLTRPFVVFGPWKRCPNRVTLPAEDQRSESIFTETTRRDSSGRFVVSYPFAKEPPRFVDSPIALNRFRLLECRFCKDSEYQYQAFMRDYLDCGHMELVSQPFPIRFIICLIMAWKTRKSTKLRVVFDASAQAINGLSLNQTMLSGPKLQQDIVAILLRFRLGMIAVTRDIKCSVRFR